MRTAAAVPLLALPTVLAFFSGGFFDGPRLVAAILVWLAFAAIAVTSRQPLPSSTPGRLALAGLVGLTCWTTASITWAPLADAATSDAERAWLYLGVFACAAALFREPRLARAVEPALAAGAVVVIGYALLTRMLPGVFPIEHSASAGGRLEQPLTYWNALGALAAVGLVLTLRLASDATRPAALQAAAAGVLPAFVLALFLTVSRGALAAAVAGVVVLLVLARDRRTVNAVLLAAVAGGLLTVLAFRLPAIENLQGDAADRRLQGLGALALMVAAGAGAALVQSGRLRGRLAPPAAVLALVVAGVALAVSAGIPEPVSAPPRSTPSTGPAGTALSPGTERLRSIKSNRYSYWKVALRGFGDHPLEGGGAHSFAVLWLRERTIAEPVQDAHSLYLETLTELGLVGVLLLALFLGGVVACAAAVWRAGPAGRALATGWLAAGAVLLAHAGLDWDWEMPALALLLVILAGAAVAARDLGDPE